jgi:hypothetical protein
MARHRSGRTAHGEPGVSGLIIQLLTTEWTTESRSGAGAPPRDTPLEMELPQAWVEPDDATFRLHHLYFSEHRNYLPREWTDVRRGRSFVEVEAFRVVREEKGVRVLLDAGRMGLPGSREWGGGARGQLQEVLFHLSPGAWGRAIYTERVQYWDTGHWGYCKHVLNVGLLEGAGLEVFRTTEPVHEVVREYLLRQGGLASAGASSARLTTAAL